LCIARERRIEQLSEIAFPEGQCRQRGESPGPEIGKMIFFEIREPESFVLAVIDLGPLR